MIKFYFSYFLKPLKDELFQYYLNLIPKKLQIKTLKYKRWQDRYNYLFSKLLLQKALKNFNYKLSDVLISEYKRPYIDANIDFNISHSENFIVCAIVEDSKIGIDIEIVKDINLSDFKQFFEREWSEIINSNNSLKSFYKFWTIKEAILKIDGRGFLSENIDMKIDVDNNFVNFENNIYQIQNINLSSSYICTIASLESKNIEIKEIKF